MEHNLPSVAKAVKLICLVLLMGLAQFLPAQDNPLNRRISVRMQEEKLADALWAMGRKGEFSFAYNPDQIPADSLVSLQARREVVRQLLDQLFQGTVVYQPIGNHIVLRLRVEEIPEAPEFIVLRGYLVDGATGDPIGYATVYEGEKHQSVLTRADGSYDLRVPGRLSSVPVSFSRVGYRDTVVVVRPGQVRNLTVGLMPRPHAEMSPMVVDLMGDKGLEDLPLVDFFVPLPQQRRAFNIQAALARFPVQMSLVPSIGTNGLMSGGMTNHVSINLLAGYASGLKGFEVGGIANLIREDVVGMQVAGISNVVGGHVLGFQTGGFSNHVKGNANGFQAAGFSNLVKGHFAGFQVGGFLNVVGDTLYGIQIGGGINRVAGKIKGFQVAGLYNQAGESMDGAQVAGLWNHAAGDVRLLQVAGLYNEGQQIGGAQVAGLLNRAHKSVGGGQIAGLGNVTRDSVGGFQIAGLFNRAGYASGLQIGLVNLADTLDGYAIGLVNWSRNGYKAIGLGSTEVDPIQLSLRTGRDRFYSYLTLGQRLPGNGRFAWSYGGGIGSSLPLFSSLRIQLELSLNQVNEEGLGYGRLNLVESFRPSLSFAPGRRIELTAGPALSLGQTSGYLSSGEFISETPRNPFWISEGYRTRVSAWWGYQASLRIRI